MKAAVVTGATGFVGQGLCESLESPAILCRDPDRARSQLSDVRPFSWDALRTPPPGEAFEGAEVVFHLAGTPILGKRWSRSFKRLLWDSRVLGTRNLVAALRGSVPRPRVLVSASAVGFYGSRGDEILSESSTPGEGFLADLCREWEKEALFAEELGVRVVCVRIGIVLERDGGALAQMLTPFKLGVGGRVGDGKQWMPWIHRQDLVAMLLHIARTDAIRGIINGVGPNPVTNREFTRHLAGTLGRPAIFPVPYLALRLAFGGVAQELIASVRVVPAALKDTGFEFRHPELRPALESILG